MIEWDSFVGTRREIRFVLVAMMLLCLFVDFLQVMSILNLILKAVSVVVGLVAWRSTPEALPEGAPVPRSNVGGVPPRGSAYRFVSSFPCLFVFAFSCEFSRLIVF